MEFRNEYSGQPWVDDSDLYRWAEEYIYLTEKFDRMLCGEDGMPKNVEQRSMCIKNAREIKGKFSSLCREAGYSIREFEKVVGKMDNEETFKRLDERY